MGMVLSPDLVKRSLAAHGWLGLLVGALMYIICLTGTLSVFYPEFERWEQPAVPEALIYDARLAEGALNRLLAQDSLLTEHMYLALPTPEIPRLSVSNEQQGWFVKPDGSLGEPVAHDWTHFLIDTHLYLTMPESFGMVVVSSLGAILVALILSGLFAHPRIFKDAFHLRLRGSGRLEQVDIHNRLSVWGTPFYLLIAVTGAYFGLVIPLIGAIGGMTDRDPDSMVASVFGEEPAVEVTGPVPVAAILADMQTRAPEATPFFITIHGAGTDRQFAEVYASHPQRMIYSENYRYDSAGRFLHRAGFSDGEVGKQVVYSMYYLHFGHFGGWWVKLLYAVLGLALTVISVTGVNIWLVKRKHRDALNDLWAGIVWGVPVALAVTAVSQIAFGWVIAALFWGALAACTGWALSRRDPERTRRELVTGWGAVVALLLVVHLIRFGTAAMGPASIAINAGLVLQLGVVAYLLRPQRVAAGGGERMVAKAPVEEEEEEEEILQSVPVRPR